MRESSYYSAFFFAPYENGQEQLAIAKLLLTNMSLRALLTFPLKVLYGVEPWTYYAANLLLNFNVFHFAKSGRQAERSC